MFHGNRHTPEPRCSKNPASRKTWPAASKTDEGGKVRRGGGVVASFFGGSVSAVTDRRYRAVIAEREVRGARGVVWRKSVSPVGTSCCSSLIFGPRGNAALPGLQAHFAWRGGGFELPSPHGLAKTLAT